MYPRVTNNNAFHKATFQNKCGPTITGSLASQQLYECQQKPVVPLLTSAEKSVRKGTGGGLRVSVILAL